MKDLTIDELINLIYSGSVYYGTDRWVEVQDLLMSKMVKEKDFSSVSTMIEKASKREHYQVIEFICSHLNMEWSNQLWSSTKTLINSKSRDARYRAVKLHSFMASNTSDYLSVVRCLRDFYQDVRLVAFHFVIKKSDTILDLIQKRSEFPELMFFHKAHNETSNMDLTQILSYSNQNRSSEYKKAIFFIATLKVSDIKNIKQLVDVLDDQDVFDYFHRYML